MINPYKVPPVKNEKDKTFYAQRIKSSQAQAVKKTISELIMHSVIKSAQAQAGLEKTRNL